MIRKKVVEALNKQLNEELYSSYLYLSMSTYFEKLGLKGHAHWMYIQAQEELVHVNKLFHFIHERQEQVILEAISAPPHSFSSPLGAFEAALEHEQKISECINNLTQLSYEEKDFATNTFLQWFINEQVEEEASVNEVIDQLKMIGAAGENLFILDKDLAQRVLVNNDNASTP